MGVCLSRCGDERLKASSMVAATDSTQFFSFANSTAASESPYNPNLSLKRFLHLNAGIADAKKSFSSTPRTSAAESLAIPPSCELFSLPGSELEPRSSFALSPPTRRASVSSHFALSPRGPKHLVESPARLERLNEGKSCSQARRCSSFRTSDFELAPRSGELKRSVSTSRSRCVRHYQLPLSKSTLSGAAPLDNSFAELLDKVERFVALVGEEPPRPSASSKAAVREVDGAVPTKSLIRLSSFGLHEDYDSEEMFTFFEASRWVDSDQSRETAKPSPVRKPGSLQRMLQAAPQACQTSPGAQESIGGVAHSDSAKSSTSSLRRGSVRVVEELTPTACLDGACVAADPSPDPLREEAGAAPAAAASTRPALKLLNVKRSSPSVMRAASKRSRRGLSRSLDSAEDSVIRSDGELYRNDAKAVPTSQFSSTSSSFRNLEAQDRSEENSEESSPASSCDLEQSGSDQKREEKLWCAESVDASTPAELPASETPSPEAASLAEDPIPSTENVELRDPDSENGAVTEPWPRTETRWNEPPPTETTRRTGEEVVRRETVPDVEPSGGASQRFLFKALNRLLKPLLASDPEQAGFREFQRSAELVF